MPTSTQCRARIPPTPRGPDLLQTLKVSPLNPTNHLYPAGYHLQPDPPFNSPESARETPLSFAIGETHCRYQVVSGSILPLGQHDQMCRLQSAASKLRYPIDLHRMQEERSRVCSPQCPLPASRVSFTKCHSYGLRQI